MTFLEEDLSVISKLPDAPTLSASQLKAKFDEGNLKIKDYINGVLIPEILALLDLEKGEIARDIERVEREIPNLASSFEHEGEGAISIALGKELNLRLNQFNEQILALSALVNSLKEGLNMRQPLILCGQGTPTGGENGDIYLMY